jgi:hypothetical protein
MGRASESIGSHRGTHALSPKLLRSRNPSSTLLESKRSRGTLPAALVDWRGDREVTRWTSEIDSMDGRAEKLVADTIVEIGARLAAARERLPRGHWLEWIDERLPFAERTAQRCIAMMAWARAEAREFERLKRLGVGKLHYIAKVDRPRGARRDHERAHRAQVGARQAQGAKAQGEAGRVGRSSRARVRRVAPVSATAGRAAPTR